MPITPDELRLVNHHLDAALESLRLASHCAASDERLADVLGPLMHELRMLRELTGVARRTRQSIKRNGITT